MPNIRVKDEGKPTIRLGSTQIRLIQPRELNYALERGMPIGLLMSLTYSTDTQVFNEEIWADDIQVAIRIQDEHKPSLQIYS